MILTASDIGGAFFLTLLPLSVLFIVAITVHRDLQLRRFAKDHGLLYSTEDALGLRRTGFHLFALRGGRSVRRDMWGRWNGMAVKSADYSISRGSSDRRIVFRRR